MVKWLCRDTQVLKLNMGHLPPSLSRHLIVITELFPSTWGWLLDYGPWFDVRKAPRKNFPNLLYEVCDHHRSRVRVYIGAEQRTIIVVSCHRFLSLATYERTHFPLVRFLSSQWFTYYERDYNLYLNIPTLYSYRQKEN